MPVPVYGSVPESIKPFGGALSATGFVGAIGYAAEFQSVTLICVSAGATFIFWFGRPHMTTIRDTSNERLKRKMTNKLGLADDGDDPR